MFTPAQTQGEIKFSQNWNKKLYGNFFTSIRLPKPYYTPGFNYKVILKDILVTRAKLVSKKLIAFDALPEYIAMLDTGMSLANTKALLIKLYTLEVLQAQGIEVLMFENLEAE